MVNLSVDMSGHYLIDETQLMKRLVSDIWLSGRDRQRISEESANLIARIRSDKGRTSPIDALLQEYGLSNAEGIILMRLAEALIRTPNSFTRNLLLRDRLIEGDWARHLSLQNSISVNAATAGLGIAKGWVRISGGVDAHNLAARLGDQVMQAAVSRVIALMAGHFVLGSDIASACQRAEKYEQDNFAFSYDMLGEAAHTAKDAERYFKQYLAAANYLAERRDAYERKTAPSISVKLSALHPQYEYAKKDVCIPALVAKLKRLCLVAAESGFGLTIDAEEADRLELSLMIFGELLAIEDLKEWTGLGLVIQAYQRRAIPVIDQVAAMARQAGRRINIRLVKGAYWDSEIKRAQEMGLESYPVFTAKENTDVSYLACARKLLGLGDVIFPAFATHNAHTAMAVRHMAREENATFEFQRLHGMGEELHTALAGDFGVVSRIYAPVGQHKELLPYLVRRLLENGANSSFVNQMADADVSAEEMARDPVGAVAAKGFVPNPSLPRPCGYLGDGRDVAAGQDWTQAEEHERFGKLIEEPVISVAACIVGGKELAGEEKACHAPYDQQVNIGRCVYGGTGDIDAAAASAKSSEWPTSKPADRADILRRVAAMLEEDAESFINLCVHEAGKTVPDAIAEIREAVDFCRYYADEAEKSANALREPLGTVACISPWNFPLAIFMGQVAAALVMGNNVIAKPAEQTPLIAYRAVGLMHNAGVPVDALHLIVGEGALLGSHLTRHPDIFGVCFTGSTRTAKAIAHSLAETGRALVPLIAETGGINAMIIDSTALLEQAVSDVVDSAFQSAGQRCSACRIVCVQEDIANDFETMLTGAMQELAIGAPTNQANDLGPVIDEEAHRKISSYVEKMRTAHRLVGESWPCAAPGGYFVTPIAFGLPSISSVQEEIFGPVLHIVRFAGEEIDAVVDEINTLGFGLTMGLHSRIDSRVEKIAGQATVGNLYVNRNQIGAVVGVQPFGGEGLSGTGPKAGGPHYLARLSRLSGNPNEDTEEFDLRQKIDLPGPTGETNRLSLYPRGRILCLGGDSASDLDRQIGKAEAAGNEVLLVKEGQSLEDFLTRAEVDAVASDHANRAKVAALLAEREGPIMPLLSGHDPPHRYCVERTLTTDTTAAGGNAELLAAS